MSIHQCTIVIVKQNCVCELETKYNNFILPYYITCFNNDVKRKEKKRITQNRPETLNKMELHSEVMYEFIN